MHSISINYISLMGNGLNFSLKHKAKGREDFYLYFRFFNSETVNFKKKKVVPLSFCTFPSTSHFKIYSPNLNARAEM